MAYGLEYEQAIRALTSPRPAFSASTTSAVPSSRARTRRSSSPAGTPSNDGQRRPTRWVQGRDVVLDNKQIQLYEKYKAKYDAQRVGDGR